VGFNVPRLWPSSNRGGRGKGVTKLWKRKPPDICVPLQQRKRKGGREEQNVLCLASHDWGGEIGNGMAQRVTLFLRQGMQKEERERGKTAGFPKHVTQKRDNEGSTWRTCRSFCQFRAMVEGKGQKGENLLLSKIRAKRQWGRTVLFSTPRQSWRRKKKVGILCQEGKSEAAGPIRFHSSKKKERMVIFFFLRKGKSSFLAQGFPRGWPRKKKVGRGEGLCTHYLRGLSKALLVFHPLCRERETMLALILNRWGEKRKKRGELRSIPSCQKGKRMREGLLPGNLNVDSPSSHRLSHRRTSPPPENRYHNGEQPPSFQYSTRKKEVLLP